MAGRRPNNATARVEVVRLWDGTYDLTARIMRGLPAWRWRGAPAGLLTRRQLRAEGLAPGGQDPVGLVHCRRGERIAYLYRRDLAVSKRNPTPAQRRAIEAMQRARRRCPECGEVQDYVIPWRVLGACIECYEQENGELPMQPEHNGHRPPLTVVDDEAGAREPALRLQVDTGWLIESVCAVLLLLAIAIATGVLVRDFGWSAWWYVLTGLCCLSATYGAAEIGTAVVLVRKHNKKVAAEEVATE